MQLFPIEQLIAPGSVAARPLLPSMRYHPAEAEFTEAATQLAWPEPELDEVSGSGIAIIGELARELGGKTPGRFVSSAKSWLSHNGVDRNAAILPWGAADDVAKISPVAASASYLAHVQAAWNQQFSKFPLEQQDVILTLPASFDEAARALTLEAAQQVGLNNVVLLEEPQAACYDWLRQQNDDLSEVLSEVKLILVCDIGGGTTDLTLIQVQQDEHSEAPKLTRIGVGDHLMLGGDNMDLALAHRLEQQLGRKKTLRSADLAQLLQQCRNAKERLLSPDAPEQTTVTLLGSGSKLISTSQSLNLSRSAVQQLALEGFFPTIAVSEKPQQRRGAIVEFGLPYASDPAITRHLAAFLQRFADVSQEALQDDNKIPIPDAVLLNGGVFHSTTVTERLLTILSSWRGTPLTVLNNANPDLAVARGAVAYGLARRGKGLKIGGGSARSYFLVLEDDKTQQAVCLLPRGAEENREFKLKKHQFALRLGQPVRFHLASRNDAKRYRAGDLTTVEKEADAFVQLPPIATVLTETQGFEQPEVPVQLATTLTEVGTLAMSCVALEPNTQRWQLEFQLRGHSGGQVINERQDTAHPKLAEAVDLINQYFGERSKAINPKGVKSLRNELEKIIGKRDSWETPLLRELFGVLLEGAKRRRRSADHERLWFNLIGFCLRPGFGYPLDDWRCQQLWSLFAQGVQYNNETQLWSEWWTLWRRIAGGLDQAAQSTILSDIAPYLPAKQKKIKIKGPKKSGYEDMVRLLGTLENLPATQKHHAGDLLLERLQGKDESPQTWWTVGKLGARVPFYGSAHNVVNREVAAQWLQQALAANWKKQQAAAFATTLLARMSGDRERDIETELRQQVIKKLRQTKSPDSWITMVSHVSELDAADEKRIFGESLPPGLRLVQCNET